MAREVALSEAEQKSKHSPVLTDTQWEVLKLISQGVLYREIASLLSMRERTVKYHVARIIHTLGVENRSQAIAEAKHLLEKH
jgi:two-component system response regulator DevR